MHGYCMNTPFDWKGKHLITNSMNWKIMLFTHLFVILSEGLPHIICCDDSSGSWEKSNQHKTVLHITILPARMSIPNQKRPG